MSTRAKVELIACFTCGGGASRDELGKTRGERLIAQLEAVQAQGGHERVTVSSTKCLWACQQSCAVHLRSPGRVGYVLAQLDESKETARGLLDYAQMYAESGDGNVPFKRWPEAVRGHFLCRMPSAPVEVIEPAIQAPSPERLCAAEPASE